MRNSDMEARDDWYDSKDVINAVAAVGPTSGMDRGLPCCRVSCCRPDDEAVARIDMEQQRRNASRAAHRPIAHKLFRNIDGRDAAGLCCGTMLSSDSCLRNASKRPAPRSMRLSTVTQGIGASHVIDQSAVAHVLFMFYSSSPRSFWMILLFTLTSPSTINHTVRHEGRNKANMTYFFQVPRVPLVER